MKSALERSMIYSDLIMANADARRAGTALAGLRPEPEVSAIRRPSTFARKGTSE